MVLSAGRFRESISSISTVRHMEGALSWIGRERVGSALAPVWMRDQENPSSGEANCCSFIPNLTRPKRRPLLLKRPGRSALW